MNDVIEMSSPSFLESPAGRAWRRLKARFPAMVGLVMIVCLVVLAVFAP
jgi:ABC-type antimicrobial peptide transport system permease subunit